MYWQENYGWSWVVVGAGSKIMAGHGWLWMVIQFSNAHKMSYWAREAIIWLYIIFSNNFEIKCSNKIGLQLFAQT